MKYDLIVAGAGPGGLMAARTAARDGLKVLLIERKKNITEINRACAQIFYINKLTANPVTGKPTPKSDGYIEQVSCEVFPNRAKFNYLDLGISLDYEGPLRPYSNWLQYSPSGNCVFRYPQNHFPWGYFYFKEAFLAGLLKDAQAAGAVVLTETTAVGAINTSTGVEVRVNTPTGELVIEGKAAIAADGLSSRIVENLGLNKDRPQRPPRQILIYLLEGVECPYHDSAWISWAIPSLTGSGSIWMALTANNLNMLGSGSSKDNPPASILDRLMKLPQYAPWFAKAKIVGKMACSVTARPPLKQVVAGNVLVVGDAGAAVETWTQGAVASAYKAVKSLEKQWSGEKGFDEYLVWWQKAFAFNKPEYFQIIATSSSLISRFNDKDMDDVYQMFKDEVGIPTLMVAANKALIKQRRPDLYEKMSTPPRGH
ncbi:MAG: NAD(P)/FAD-dependent oxidoreductase [Chloroflexota bacterium]